MVAFKSRNEAAKADAAAYLETIALSIWTGFDGVWFVKTGKNAVEIRDRLKCLSAPDEGIVIALLAGFAAWHGFDAETEKWLLKHL